MTSIPLLDTAAALPYVMPDIQDKTISESHSALAVMTDFEQVKPITVEPFCNINLAVEKMRSRNVRLLLVTDEQDYINGVITSYDIQSEKPVNYAREHGVSHIDICVSMIMTPLQKTPAFDLAFVKRSLVGHIIHTMKELKRPHTLVIDATDTQQPIIRGMFSTAQISRMLGRPVYRPLRTAASFAELQQEKARM